MLCIKNGTIVSPEGRKKADLFIEDGKIVSVGGELPFDECWDAEGCLLFPGFIAVSYTHLDVYKRQREAFALHRLPCARGAAGKAG